MPVSGAPVVSGVETKEEADVKAAATPTATPAATTAVVKIQPIESQEIVAVINEMVADGKGRVDDDILTSDDLIGIIVDSKLNTAPELKPLFRKSKPEKKAKSVSKNAIVTAMASNKEASETLEIIAYGVLF